MKTYEDLVKVGENDTSRALFCHEAVKEFKGTRLYADAQVGQAYYDKHNLTIENFQKFLYTLSGAQVPDIFSANYKLKTTYFRRMVIQQVQYVLGNGVVLQKTKNKEKLGKKFDHQLVKAAKMAMAQGRAFGFWNLDHLEVFSYADTPNEPGFCPLYSENSKLEAGIRYWYSKVGDDRIFRATLYEIDGFTKYAQKNDEQPTVVQAKTSYKNIVKFTQAEGVVEEIGENYTDLPIVTMYANDTRESELNGHRECIDCYDFVKSGFANNIDDFDGLFWLVKNTGGMDDTDLAKFLQRMRTVRGASVEGDEGTDAVPTTVEVPTEARSRMLDILRADLYEDFQSVDIKSLSASAKTTQEIKAAFQAMDDKCAEFEYAIIDFVQDILELAGIDDEPTFVWNKMINQQEQTNMVLSAANYLTDDAIIKHLPFLTPEEQDAIIKERNTDAYLMAHATPEPPQNDEEEDDAEENPTEQKKDEKEAINE